MPKILLKQINSCSQCDYCTVNCDELYCGYSKKPIFDTNKIPSFCELEDFDEAVEVLTKLANV